MAIVLFFGICAFFLVISTIYVTVAIRHHIKEAKNNKLTPKTEPSSQN